MSLAFDTIHSLSNAISGTIGDLGDLNINGGTLSFDKEPTGTITTVKVNNGATLDLGTNTLRSYGDKADSEGVYFADNSTLAFTATDSAYGKIDANYIKIGETGTTLKMSFNKAALASGQSETFDVLDSDEIEGAFANLTSNSRYKFEDAGDGSFKVTNVASASDIVKEIGGTTNNAGTAEAWDGIATGSVGSETVKAIANKLAQLSNSTNASEKQTYVDALTALAPEASPSVQSTSTETANQVFGAVGTRLSGGSAGSQQGMSSGDNPFKQVSAWIQGLFNKSKLDDTSSAKGFDADTYGTAFGLEKQLDAKSKVGIGYAYSQTDIDGFMRKTDVDTHTAIAYGEYKPTANTYVNAIATYGFADYSEKKNVAGSQVKADYDVDSFGLQTMAGYNFDIKNATLTPEAGLRYVNIKQKAYTDTAGQKISSNSSDILTGVVGAKVSKELTLNNGFNFKPELRAAATYDLSNDDANSVVTLANGSSYTTQGKALKRFGMEFGAGVSADINDRVEMSVGYEGKFRSNYKDHSGLVNFKYKF